MVLDTLKWQVLASKLDYEGREVGEAKMAFVEKSAGHNWHTQFYSGSKLGKKLSSWLTISNLDSNLDFDLKQHSQAYFGLFLVRRIWRFNF